MIKKTVSVLLAVLMLAGLVPAGAFQAFAAETDAAVSDDPYPTLTLGETTTVTITREGNNYQYYTVTSEETVGCTFYSTGDHDTVAYLYDEDMNQINYNDDYNGRNFSLTQVLYAGETYYLRLSLYSYNYDDEGKITFDLHTELSDTADWVSITQGSEISGYTGTEIQLDATLSPSDAPQESFTWTSSDTSVVEVDQSYQNQNYCRVRLVAAGTATVTASVPSGPCAQAAITVLDPEEIQVGTPQHVSITTAGARVMYRFVAPASRTYGFYSSSADGEYLETYGNLYNSEMNHIAGNYNGAGNGHFRIVKQLTEGETCYIGAQFYYSEDTGEFDLNVEEVPYAESISITSGNTLSGFVGYRTYLETMQSPENSVHENVSWESSAPEVASVSYYGEVSFKTPGTAVITATTERGLTDTCTVTVYDYIPLTPDTAATAVIPNSGNFAKFKFTAPKTATYEFYSSNASYGAYAILGTLNDGYEDQLTYKSSESDNNFHLQYALTEGVTYYLCAGFNYSNSTGEFDVTVTELPTATGMDITQGTELSGKVGNIIPLSVSFTPQNSAVESVTWESSDDSVLTVSYNGEVRCIGGGVATVTATSANGLTAECEITVAGAESVYAGEPKEVRITTPGDVAIYKFVPETTGKYSFYSTGDYDTYGYLLDSVMDTVDYNDDGGIGSNFKIIAELEAGNTYFVKSRFYSNDTKGSFDLHVEEVPAATGISIVRDGSLSGYPGDGIRLSVQMIPENAESESVSWSTSDSSIADVDEYDGYLRLRAPGTAEITATTGSGFTDTVTVTVLDYVDIEEDEVKSVTITNELKTAWFRFVPEESRSYVFSSSGMLNPCGVVYDGDLNYLNEASYGGQGSNFRFSCELTGGETYYFKTYLDYYDATGTYSVKVSPIPYAESMTISARTLAGCEGEWINMSTDFLPAGTAYESVSWQSSDTSVATVDDYGEVHLISAGTADITATSQRGLTDTVTVRVKSIEDITAGETKTINVTSPGERSRFRFIPEEEGQYAVYSTGDRRYYGAVLNSEMNRIYSTSGGKLSFTSIFGSGYTYYLDFGFSSETATGSFEVTLIKCPQAQSLGFENGDRISGYPNETATLKPVFLPEYSISQSLTFESADTGVAEVDEEGTITFKQVGETTVTATSSAGLTATCRVVTKEYETLSIGETKTCSINEKGGSVVYKVTVAETAPWVFWSAGSNDTYAYLYDEDFELISENDDGGSSHNFRIADNLEANKTYLLKVRFYNSSKTGRFTVGAATIPYADSLTITPSSMTAYIGSELSLNTVFEPSGSYNEPLSWTSSDDSVVSVSYGSAYATALGTATLTATSERGLTATCVVTVVDPEPIALDEVKDVDMTYSGEIVKYRFVPETSGCYVFESTGNLDTYGTMETEDGELFVSNDNGGTMYNFHAKAVLEAGQSCILTANIRDKDNGSFKVTVKRGVTVTGMELLSPPDKLTCIKGYEDSGDDDYTGLSVKTTWSDGEEVVWNYGDGNYVRDEKISTYRTISHPLGSDEVSDVNLIVECGDFTVSCPYTLLENPVASIAVTGGGVSVIENAGGHWSYRYNPVTNEYDIPYFYYSSYDTSDVEVTVYYKNGATAVTHVGDVLDGRYVSYSSDQESNPWTRGGSNEILVEYLGVTATLSAVVTENPVESITVLGEPEQNLIENMDGYESSRYNSETGEDENYFYYYLDKLTGVPVRINYKDGSTVTSSLGNSVDGYRIGITSNQSETPFTLGSGNTAYVTYMGVEAPMGITVEPNPVDHLELLAPSENVLIENADGRISSRYDPISGTNSDYFYYELYTLSDARVKIFFKDGTTAESCVNESVNGYYVSYGADSQSDTPFTVGSDNRYLITYMGHSVEATATVIENPVTGISVIGGYRATVIENNNGYWNTAYNPDTGEYDIRYYHYYGASLSDMNLLVTFADGSAQMAHVGDAIMNHAISTTNSQYSNPWVIGGDNYLTVSLLGYSETVPVDVLPNPVESIWVVRPTATTLIENSDGYYYNYSSSESYFEYTLRDISDAVIGIKNTDGTTKTANVGDTVDGYKVTWSENQDKQHWTVGSDNYVTIDYMGQETPMAITIVPTPLSDLTVTSAPTRVYVYNDSYYGYNDSFNPSDLTGLAFTATFKNGTVKHYTAADIHDGMVDGYPISYSTTSLQKVGSNTVKFGYMGLYDDYTVQVIDNTVSGLTVTRLPDVPEYSQYYSPNWKGMQFKVSYTNGSEKLVTLTDSNTVYGFSSMMGFFIGVEIDGNMATITMNSYSGDDHFVLRYLGKRVDITGLTCRTDKTVKDVKVENFAYNGQNMLLKATYEDGTTENIRLTNVKDCRKGWGSNAFTVRAMTSKGLLTFYTINPEEASNYHPYDVYAFGIDVLLDSAPILGDVDGDGTVTIGDVTLIQCYIAEYPITDTDRMLLCGDVDGNGRVNIKDATAVQRYLADFGNPYGIGNKITG